MRQVIKVILLLICSVPSFGQIQPIFMGGSNPPYNPAITSWNPYDKNANINLLNSYLTAKSLAIAGFEMVRCNKVCSTGTKQYFETTLGTAGFDLYIGFDNGAGSLSAQPGSGSNAIAYYASLGEIIVNGSAVQTGLATATTGDIIDALYDATLNTVTYYKNNTMIGTPQAVTGGNMFPMVGRGAGVNQTTSTTNFGATTPTYTFATYTLGPP